jgi:hypothetical protein
MKRLFTFGALLVCFISLSLSTFAQSSREDLLREIKAKRTELESLEKQFLAPTVEDVANHSEFLNHKNTGIIRLLPRETYESDTYKKNQKTLTLRGGGAYYSFSRLTHEYGYGSDIGLEQNYLSVGFAGADYGMMTNLGDVPLEAITLEHPATRFLVNYEVPSEESQARVEQRRFAIGTNEDGIAYSRRLPVELNRTFLVRSISYSGADVLVAFRMVRKDTDGSIILVWKLLKKYPVPELTRQNQ